MKLRNALLAATVLAMPAAILAAPAAQAQPADGLYIGAGAGGNILQTEAVRSISNGPANFGRGTDYRFDAGPVVVASVGYGLGRLVEQVGLPDLAFLTGFRIELQGAGYDNRINRVKNGGAGFLRTTSTGGDEYKYGALVNILYDLPLRSYGIESPVNPYIGFGGGYMHNQYSNLHVTTVNPNGTTAQFLRSTGQSDNAAVQGIAGVAFPLDGLTPGLSLTAEYRFMGEVGGRSIKEQYFAPRVAIGTRQKFATDDFNHSILAGVRYSFGTPTPPPPPPAAPVVQQAPTRTYLVFFDWDRADLTDRARQIVAEAAQASTRVQATRIEVQGNADLSGTKQYNQKLSLRRAQTVAAELVRDGVPRTAIDIQAFGDTRPLVQTAPGVREPQNRRVAIILR